IASPATGRRSSAPACASTRPRPLSKAVTPGRSSSPARAPPAGSSTPSPARTTRPACRPSARASTPSRSRCCGPGSTRGPMPTPAEVDAFVNDPRPDAYEHVVDRLLASPHYGERWGRHWLDLARYADSHGFTIDGARTIWPYRDWVLNALNRDLPFDQFVIEQLAGDLLPKATRDQRVATGFH